MTELTAPIVGMHFRPPAKEVVNLLPPGTRVLLRREPSNEYDEFAVQVLLPGFRPYNAEFATDKENGAAGTVYNTIAESGSFGEDLYLDKDPLHLAFVDSKKTGMARMFSQAMLFVERQKQNPLDEELRGDYPLPDKLLYFEAKLAFDLAGKPQVVTELQVAKEQYEEDRAVLNPDDVAAGAEEDAILDGRRTDDPSYDE